MRGASAAWGDDEMHEFLLSLVPDRGHTLVMSIGAGLGALVSFAFGEISAGMQWLFIFVVADYITGSCAAWIAGKYSSDAGLRGLARKTVIFLLVAVAHGVDQMAVGMPLPFLLRDVLVCALGLNEIVSLIENIDRLGGGDLIPAFVRRGLYALQKKAEAKIEGAGDDQKEV